MADVIINAPDPKNVKPILVGEEDKKQYSRVEFDNANAKMTCQCTATNLWQLVCTLSYDVKIYISKKESLKLGIPMQKIYGHEQKHVKSRELVVIRRVRDKLLNDQRPAYFKSLKECESEIRYMGRNPQFWLEQSLHRGDNHLGKDPEFSNDESPENKVGYPVFDETPDWKELR